MQNLVDAMEQRQRSTQYDVDRPLVMVEDISDDSEEEVEQPNMLDGTEDVQEIGDAGMSVLMRHEWSAQSRENAIRLLPAWRMV